MDLEFQIFGIYSSMRYDLIDEPFLVGGGPKVIESLCFPLREEVIVVRDVPPYEVGMEGRL
jgi:hypothetical protein